MDVDYYKNDIETLREKLIEDLHHRFYHECGVCGQIVITDDEIREIINKRFGVEKE